MEQSSCQIIMLKKQLMLIQFLAGHLARDLEMKHQTSSLAHFKVQLPLNKFKMKDITVVAYYLLANRLANMQL